MNGVTAVAYASPSLRNLPMKTNRAALPLRSLELNGLALTYYTSLTVLIAESLGAGILL